MKKLSVPERLARVRFVTDEDESHIVVNQAIAKATGTGKVLVAVCPAQVYREEADGTISVEYAACLECGTCRIICDEHRNVDWEYPRGGYGILFKFG